MTTESLILSPKAKNALALKIDKINVALDNATPLQISTWVDNHITTSNPNMMPDLRRVLKFILLYIKAH